MADSLAEKDHRRITDKLRQVIQKEPGLPQSRVVKRAKVPDRRGKQLLKKYDGHLWRSESGPRNPLLYYPIIGDDGGSS